MTPNGRNYNLDLLRILATFMVVLLHVQLFGGLLENQKISVAFLPTVILESLCIVAVNCFVLITGFFMIYKQVNWKKLLNLWFEIAVISWVIFAIGTACGLRAPLIDLIQHIFPTLSGCHWFVSTYIIVYILSPWINKLIHSLSRRECFFLLIVCFLIFSVWARNPKINNVTVGKGYSVLWLSYIYFIGAIIRIYIKRLPYPGILYWISSLFTTGFAILSCKYTHTIGHAMNYNSPFVLIASIGLFMYFYNLNITHSALTKFIAYLTPGCFGVFLIHTDLFVRPLYVYLFKFAGGIPVWVVTIVGATAIFSGSILIARNIHLITNWFCTNFLIKWIEQKLLSSTVCELIISKYKTL